MPRRPKMKNREAGQPMTQAQRDEMFKLIKKQQKCCSEIAREVGCRPNTVRHHAIKLGVELPHGEIFGRHRLPGHKMKKPKKKKAAKKKAKAA